MRRVERAPDDGYDNELAPGLRASADARRLADELAFSAARLEQLAVDPPGPYGELASAADVEEACWLAFLVAYLGPLEGPLPFAGIEAARVAWDTGELPALDGVALGPRTSHEPGRGVATLVAYREWAARAGSQRAALLGEPGWEPERRFARALERLALPGLRRGARFELLTSLGAVGVLPLVAGALALASDGADPVALAANRVLGIGDAINLERRAKELAEGVGVPLAALDLALFNWVAEAHDRVTMGSQADGGPRREAIAVALGVA